MSDGGPESGARNRRESMIGIRNCLEFLLEESKTQDLSLTVWLLRMGIASIDEELNTLSAQPDTSAGSENPSAGLPSAGRSRT